MKYKVGDKVRVRKDLTTRTEYVSDGMLEYKGKVSTIVVASERTNDYCLKGMMYYWTDEMLEKENKDV